MTPEGSVTKTCSIKSVAELKPVTLTLTVCPGQAGLGLVLMVPASAGEGDTHTSLHNWGGKSASHTG